MRTISRSAIALSTMALASAGLALGAGSASAALTTYCDGDAADVTVPGDLVVAKDKSCVLTGVTIEGEVRVQAGADLLITDSSVADRVVVQADGYFDSTGSEVGANVVSNGGYGVYLDDSTVAGSYVGRAGEDADPFLYSYDTAIDGRVAVEQGILHLQTVTVGGALTSENSQYTDVIDSTVSRDLTVTGAAEGSALCGSEVDGAATYTANVGVQIGTGGNLIDCEDTNYLGGDVTVSDNTGGVDVSGNIVRGDLAGEGNDPAPTGADNRVRGESSGQFADLAPAASTMSAQSSTKEHAKELDAQREERRAAAEDAAELSGPANLR
ncbi:hypothetical protein ACT3SP_09795 [Brachybacterium sp. AOP43-C2-M15]|uniref:hypothetical protein n=1 Tax=Brachybacterium sp. AOP43-C2-M15 TaxID=3457661 RepID=UPI0040338390